MLNSYIYKVGTSSPHANLTDRRGNNGPNELADVVVHFLRGMPPAFADGSTWVTEAGLRKLIEVAFFTSFAPEEGRYPRCSLFWSIYPHEWFDVGSFLEAMPLDVATLRKLAPISQIRNSAIRVGLRDDDLVAVGVTALRFEGLNTYPGRPEFTAAGRELNFQLHILGPGHLRADCSSVEFELRAGEIRQCSQLRSLPVVTELATEFAAAVGDEVISKLGLGEEECKLFGGLQTCFRGEKILELVLRPILDAGHGGAVLVIPVRADPCLRESLLLPNEVTDFDLRHRSVDYLSACVDFHYPTDANRGHTSRTQRWLQTRGRLSIAARAIGELAAVDGCVVLDRALSVVGFGAKINISREQAIESPIKFRNAKTDEHVPFDELEQLGGMRFQSALRFCKCYPNVVAFVVSQDQEMKVLWSRDKDAFAFGPIAMSTIPDFA